MSQDQARTIIIALVHDGINAEKLTETARRQIREALEVVLATVQLD